MTMRQNLLWAGVFLGSVFATDPSSAAPIAWSYQGGLVDDDTGETVVLSNWLNSGSGFLIGYQSVPGGDTSANQTINLAWISQAGHTTPSTAFPFGNFRLSLLLMDLATGEEATLSVLGRASVWTILDDNWEFTRAEVENILKSWVVPVLHDGQEQSVSLGGNQYHVRFLVREEDDGNAYLDAEVKVTDSPEPGTFMLMAGGIISAGIGTFTRSRRRDTRGPLSSPSKREFPTPIAGFCHRFYHKKKPHGASNTHQGACQDIDILDILDIHDMSGICPEWGQSVQNVQNRR